MTAIRYPDKVWAAIKKLWEVSPKATSLQTILNQAAETLECDVPSIPTVHTRIKREKWKKLTPKELKGIAKIDTKNTANFSSNDDEKKQVESTVNSDFISTKKNENDADKYKAIPALKMELITYAEASTKLNKIESLRKQAWNVFNITQSAIDGLAEYIAKLETTDFSQADEQDLKVLTFELSVFEKMVNIANTASMVNERTTKTLVGLHGFELDDFKDKQEIQAQRSAQLLKLDNLLEEKRLLMAEQQKQAFERNLAAIEDKMRSG